MRTCHIHLLEGRIDRGKDDEDSELGKNISDENKEKVGTEDTKSAIITSSLTLNKCYSYY